MNNFAGVLRAPGKFAEAEPLCRRVLEIDVADLASRTRRRHVVEARRVLLSLGRERWGQKANELGVALGKKANTISYPAREGIRRRFEDGDFARRYEALDKAMIAET